MKKFEIQLSNCLIILTENELMQCLALKPKVFEIAIGRGKGKLRAQSSYKRQLKGNAENFNRWKVYELLKANDIELNNNVVSWVEGMDDTELKEGVIEYLLTKNRTID